MQVVQRLLAGIAQLWSKGCVGKSIVVLGGLFVLGLCGAITGGGRTAAPAPGATAAPVATAAQAKQPTEPPAPTAAPTERPTVAPTIPPIPTEAPKPTAAPAQPKPTAVPAAPKPKPTAAPAPKPASFDRNGDGKVQCNDFDTRAEAKKALDAGHKNLDNDHDGIPCESLP